MKRITIILLSLWLGFSFFAPTANACCGYDGYGGGVYYPDFRPGYYGNVYYGGGLIYYPNSDFFYHIPRSGVAYNNDVNCQLVPGCNSCNGCARRYVRRYSCSSCTKSYYVKRHIYKCEMVPGHRDKHGCWIKKHKVCWY